MKDKKKIIIFLLCFFLGMVGAHRFYLKKYKSAIFMMLTLSGFGFWYIFDLYSITKTIFRKKSHAPV